MKTARHEQRQRLANVTLCDGGTLHEEQEGCEGGRDAGEARHRGKDVRERAARQVSDEVGGGRGHRSRDVLFGSPVLSECV